MTPTPPNKIPLAPSDTILGEEQRRNQWMKSRLNIDTDGAFGPVDINGVTLNSSQSGQSLTKQLSRTLAGELRFGATVSWDEGGGLFGGGQPWRGGDATHGDSYPVGAILLSGLDGVKPGGYTTYKAKVKWSVDAEGVGSCVCVQDWVWQGAGDSFRKLLDKKIDKAPPVDVSPFMTFYKVWEFRVPLDHVEKSTCGECISLPGGLPGSGRISGDSAHLDTEEEKTYYIAGRLPHSQRHLMHNDFGFGSKQVQQAIFDSEVGGGGSSVLLKAQGVADYLDKVTCATHCDGL